jgi:hypothetical protein
MTRLYKISSGGRQDEIQKTIKKTSNTPSPARCIYVPE